MGVFETTNSRGLPVAGKQSKRVIINVTPEQQAAVNVALERLGDDYPSKNAALLAALSDFCAKAGIELPEANLPLTEGPNWKQGKGGKFVKKG